MGRQKYINDSFTIDANGQAFAADCVDIMFINYGTNTLAINQAIRVPPPATVGQFTFLVLSGNGGEEDVTKYTCKFTGPAGANPNDAVVIRRMYK